MGLNRDRARTRNTEQGVAVLVHFNAMPWHASTVTNATGAWKFVMPEMTSNHPVNTDGQCTWCSFRDVFSVAAGPRTAALGWMKAQTEHPARSLLLNALHSKDKS